MNCKQCGNTVPDNRRDCPSCGEDNGYPNVRLANSEVELAALEVRYQAALVSADARGVVREAERFHAAIAQSEMVISRPLSLIVSLIDSERSNYVSFQRQVEARLLEPSDNIYDRVRVQYEEALYPHFSKEIIFGSLTLIGRGITAYGPYAMVLKTSMIEKRATVFEENPHRFIGRHRLLGNEPIIPGYRGDWQRRIKVAFAKLQPELTKGMSDGDFPAILQRDVGGTGDADFIEVHVYGSINRNAIESIVGPKPRLGSDRIMWKAATEKMRKLGITVVTT